MTDKEVGGFELPYIPDFIYDEGNGLLIDIEIDEIYSLSDLCPIHYVDIDNLRDNYFLDHGWLIIRFTEEQILRFPQSCCRAVAEVIKQVLKEKDI